VIDATLTRSRANTGSAPFILTAFLGAALIFLVQPMFARMATPLLGGAPAVWNVSLVCFQAALLAGYAYAHVLSRFKSTRTQVIIHAVVLIAGFACLPLHISGLMGSPDPAHPALWLLSAFAVSIAPPFAALSATAPLIQHWYARSGRPDAADPYHLYAASNVGSLIGLAAYPFAIEPFTTLTEQSGLWTIGYVMLGAMLLFSGWMVMTSGVATASATTAADASAKPTLRQMAMWLALSFVPSSLLVGATSHITTDVAAAPFLWAPPLMIYLITFVIAFARKPFIPNDVAVALAPLAAALAALILSGRGPNSLPLTMAVDLLALFLIALACHGALKARRPDAAHLTQFYLIMSLGGVLGGAFNALLAPVIFDSVLEYPLMLVVSLALLSAGGPKIARVTWILLAASAVALAAAWALRSAHIEASPVLQIALIGSSVLAIIISRRAPLGAALALACAIPTGWSFATTLPTWSDRSFFGVIKVVDLPEYDTRLLMHGTTVHGAQAINGDRLLPRSYYAPVTPIGQAFRLYSDAHRVGIVGLGAGSTACYSRPDQDWTFFEIDPLVAKVATDPSRFTFMSSCRPGAKIVLGDARIELARLPSDSFDLLLLDAFSSDSVPTHLLTAEAMKLYLDRLSPEGVLVFHISNRHLRLDRVVARVAQAAGAEALIQKHKADARTLRSFADATSIVVLVSKNHAALERARAAGQWRQLEADAYRPWTDGYSNIVGAMIDQITSKQD